MKRALTLLLLCSLSLPAAASHGWSGMDLCTLYQDRLPPGLTAEQLPEAMSHGAGLLDRYCTQCHNLPGPDRHSAAEWRQLLPKMYLLMEVAERFGSQRGEVATIPAAERPLLLAYLQRHAGDPTTTGEPEAAGAAQDHWLYRALTLLPVLLLTSVGLLRWRRKRSGRGYRPCVAE